MVFFSVHLPWLNVAGADAVVLDGKLVCCNKSITQKRKGKYGGEFFNASKFARRRQLGKRSMERGK